MEETTLFFSECMCNYCHTPVTPRHPRQGRRGGMMRREEGEEMSLGAAGVLVSGKKEEDKEERKNKRAC